MSVADSTARLTRMPAGTPRVRRMRVTGTRAPDAVRGTGAVSRCSMRHSEVNATAQPAPATSRARALPPARSASSISRPAAIGPINWPREAPMVKWPKLRSCSCGADWRATSDWEPMTKQRWPSPITPLHRAIVHREPARPLRAQPPDISSTPTGSRGAQRPWSVRRPSGTAAKNGSRAYTPAMTPIARSSAPSARAR